MLLLAPTLTYAQGQNFPGGSTSSNTQTGVLPGVTLASNFGVKGDTKFCFDVNTTISSPIITSAGQCVFTSADVGKQAILSSICAPTICGFGQYLTADVLTSTAPTILSVNGSSATLSANATATTSNNTAGIAYGTNDDVALEKAYTGMIQASPCGTLQLTGWSMVATAHFIAVPRAACSTRNVAVGVTNQGQALNNSVTIQGTGPGTSGLIIQQNFSFTGCTGGTAGTSCFFSMTNMLIRDMTIWGFANALTGQTNNFQLVGPGTGTWYDKFWLVGYGRNDGGLVGVALNYGYMTNSFIEAVGHINIDCGGGDYQQIVNTQIGITDGSNGGESFHVSPGGPCFTTNMTLYGNGTGASGRPGVVVDGNWQSSNDHYLDTSNTASSDIFINNSGAQASLINTTFTGAALNHTALNVSANTTVTIQNFKIGTVSAVGTGITNAGTIYDFGGVTIVATTPYTGTGTVIADGHQLTGACTGVATASSTLGLYGTGPNETATTCTSATIGSGVPVNSARTLSTLIVTSSAVGVSAASGVVTVLKNGSATTITCTIGTTTSCIDGTHTVALVAGDLISIQFTSQAADTLAGVKASVLWR